MGETMQMRRFARRCWLAWRLWFGWRTQPPEYPGYPNPGWRLAWRVAGIVWPWCEEHAR